MTNTNAAGWALIVSTSSRKYKETCTINPGKRYGRPHEHSFSGPRINERIRITPILLINEKDEKVGIIETAQALARARDAGLDLVEVAPDSKPPVCRILDFGKYKYEQAKKDKASKSKSKTTDLKEVRLGRSMKIDPHDVEIRIQQARRFLMDGHKVQIVLNFVGREMMHKDRGYARMKEINERLSDIAKMELGARMAGRRLSAIFAPDRAKVEQLKRREAGNKTKPASSAATSDGEARASAQSAPAPAPAQRLATADATTSN